jgi:hypothetical protein
VGIVGKYEPQPPHKETAVKELYNDGRLRVFTNGSGEIFVKHLQDDKATVRISPGRILHITAHSCEWMPSSFGGLGGFYVRERK